MGLLAVSLISALLFGLVCYSLGPADVSSRRVTLSGLQKPSHASDPNASVSLSSCRLQACKTTIVKAEKHAPCSKRATYSS
ncbi:hypothetical protein ATANTOWER_019536 [Ataeniobius toweri]|uniref:Secreted protein n=1 Tax=Ataeniobius toweri TaxID=208326 RepID=A0ABU7AQ39_9TELE|nr:hypothetical protein [Ataeniobius toweri]